MPKVTRIQIPELEATPDVNYRKWTLKEKTVLALYYGIKETSAIAKHLKRPTHQISNVARGLGLKFGISQKERDQILNELQEGRL
jgi:hypothetical protein